MKKRKANVVCVLTLSTLAPAAPGVEHLLPEQNDRAHQVGAKLKCKEWRLIAGNWDNHVVLAA